MVSQINAIYFLINTIVFGTAQELVLQASAWDVNFSFYKIISSKCHSLPSTPQFFLCPYFYSLAFYPSQKVLAENYAITKNKERLGINLIAVISNMQNYMRKIRLFNSENLHNFSFPFATAE